MDKHGYSFETQAKIQYILQNSAEMWLQRTRDSSTKQAVIKSIHAAPGNDKKQSLAKRLSIMSSFLPTMASFHQMVELITTENNTKWYQHVKSQKKEKSNG